MNIDHHHLFIFQYRKRFMFLLSLLVVFIFSCGSQKADIVLKNGDIYTVEQTQRWAKVVVITGSKITAVLDDEKMADQYIGSSSRVIDLDGALAIPGFIDAHVHFAAYAAVNRTDNDGKPKGGWHPNIKLRWKRHYNVLP